MAPGLRPTPEQEDSFDTGSCGDERDLDLAECDADFDESPEDVEQWLSESGDEKSSYQRRRFPSFPGRGGLVGSKTHSTDDECDEEDEYEYDVADEYESDEYGDDDDKNVAVHRGEGDTDCDTRGHVVGDGVGVVLQPFGERGRRRFSAIMISGIVGVVTVILAVGLGVGLGIRDRREHSTVVTNDRSGNIVIPSPPSDLAVLCEESNVQNAEGLRICMEKCQHASCCLLEGGNSCRQSHRDLCSGYAPCFILTTYDEKKTMSSSAAHADIPEPPSDLANLCSDATEESKIMCNNVCSVALCCVSTGVDKCANTPRDVDVCQSYAPCWDNLANGEGLVSGSNHDDESVDTARSDGALTTMSIVKSTCDEHLLNSAAAPDAEEQCRKICMPAMCCSTSSHGGECDSIRCEEYEACNILSGWGSTDGNDMSVENHMENEEQAEWIRMVCSAEKINAPDGMSQCEDACALGECCFPVVPEEEGGWSCRGESFCSVYEPCRNIFIDHILAEGTEAQEHEVPEIVVPMGYSNTNAHANVLDACGRVLNTPHGLAECKAKCGPGSCCFRQGPGGCFNHPRCEDYSECELIYHLETAGRDGA